MNILQLFKMCNSVVIRGIKKRLCYENILFIELKATLLSLPPCERANQNLELIIHENETNLGSKLIISEREWPWVSKCEAMSIVT